MKKYKILVFPIILFCLSHTDAQAQHTLAATGLDASSNSGSISYTIGQIDYISLGISISVSQGVQQSFEKLEVVINSAISVTVWPNPSFNMLNIKIKDDDGTGLEYQLYDMNGRLLENKKNDTNFVIISLANFSPATYILLVTHLNQKATSFKIIKY